MDDAVENSSKEQLSSHHDDKSAPIAKLESLDELDLVGVE